MLLNTANELSSGSGNMYIIPTAVGPLGATKDTNWKPMLMWTSINR